MSSPESLDASDRTLLDAIEAADDFADPARPSDFARDRAAYAEALHLAAPSAPAGATSRTLQRVAALGMTAAALLVVGAGWFVPPTEVVPSAGAVLQVDAWRVGGRGAEPLLPRDTIEPGELVQLSVTTSDPKRVAVWTRSPHGVVRARVPAEGTLIAEGDRVPIEARFIFDGTPGTEHIAVQVCPADQVPGADPWSETPPPDGCRPFLFSLKKQT